MSTPTNHFKLGLFVIFGSLAGLVLVLALGARALSRDVLEFYTFFNESVQGLEVGSPVKYRGVSIGTVSSVDIGPDNKHVSVQMNLDQKDVLRLGMADDEKHVHVPRELRTQIVSQGITGVKFVQIDFFNPDATPVEALPFEAPANTIAAAPSLLKSLEDAITGAVGKIPDILQHLVKIMSNIDGLLSDLRQSNVTQSANTTLSEASTMLRNLNGVVSDLRGANLFGKAGRTLDNLDAAMAKLNTSLEKVSSEKGLLSTAQRAADAYAELGRNANGTNRELERTLREVRETVETIRSLVDALEREPDMLIKGRAQRKSP